jgi:hypothetical protein
VNLIHGECLDGNSICHCHRCGGDWLRSEILESGACPDCPEHTDIHASLSVPILPRDTEIVKERIERIKARLNVNDMGVLR